MPPKRPSPLEEHPPSASSSGEETEDEEEVQATDAEEEEEELGSEEEDEEIEEPKPTQPSKPISQIPKSKPIPKPQSDDDSDDGSDASDEEKVNLADESGSGSDSDSDNEHGPVKHMLAPRNADVKPISSKPMNVQEPPSKPKKPTSTPTPNPISAPKNSLPAKRPLENEKKDKRDRKKKKVADIEDEEETEKKGGGEDKKTPNANPIQRIWSEEDEIVLLKGLIDYKKKGFDPFNNHLNGLLDMIKSSLHVENLKNHQLLNKVQRLRQKYLKNASRAKPGEDPVISRPHELNSYQLSKLIWADKDEGVEANHVGSESVKSDAKKSKNQVSSNGVASSPKRKVTKVAANSPKVVVDNPKVVADTPKVVTSSQKVERKEEDGGSGSEFLFLNGSVQSHSIPLMPVPPQGLGEIFAKKGWDSVKSLNAGTLDQRWKAMLIAETQVYLDRLELVRDQTKGMLDALMSDEF